MYEVIITKFFHVFLSSAVLLASSKFDRNLEKFNKDFPVRVNEIHQCTEKMLCSEFQNNLKRLITCDSYRQIKRLKKINYILHASITNETIREQLVLGEKKCDEPTVGLRRSKRKKN